MAPSDQEEPEYISHATLMVLGRELQPSAVSALLRMRASKSWQRGQTKMFRGKPLGDAPYESGAGKNSCHLR